MVTVLVHNDRWRSEKEALARRNGTRKEVWDWYWWNLWMRRQVPFNLLADGMPVVLLDSWPGGGELSWLVRAKDVHRSEHPDKHAAVRDIAKWAGVTRKEILSDPYTAGRPGDAGKALFWRAEPVRRLGLPKPPGLHLLRNGWLVTDEAQLAGWNLHLSPATSAASQGGAKHHGQGPQQDVATRIAVEARAMTVATDWCRRQGWQDVRDVSASESWDLEAKDTSGNTRYIEVKGLTGSEIAVEVTRAEVKSACGHRESHSIIIVSEIRVDGAGLTRVASGGKVTAFDPWRPQNLELTPQQYVWRPVGRAAVSGYEANDVN